MTTRIYPLVVRDVFATFAYFVVDEETRHGVLVDPGAQAEILLREIRQHGWKIDAVLLTHGHFDHFGAARELREKLSVPVMAHEQAERYLMDPYLNLSAAHHRAMTLENALPVSDGESICFGINEACTRLGESGVRALLGENDVCLDESSACPDGNGERLNSDHTHDIDCGTSLRVLHVPGHTNDSCAFYCERAGVALVGDVLYDDGPGLTVFPTGNASLLRESITSELLSLPPETLLLSGHSQPMTVEKLKGRMRNL